MIFFIYGERAAISKENHLIGGLHIPVNSVLRLSVFLKGLTGEAQGVAPGPHERAKVLSKQSPALLHVRVGGGRGRGRGGGRR